MQMPQDVGTFHIIGIGGIGMSAIAEILLAKGYAVQGSDQKDSANVRRLRSKGIRVFIGHDAINLVGARTVVISTAVKALRLMMRGNSVVHEWLASPHVYVANECFVAALAPIARAWRSAYADAHHYHGLLATQRGRFIAGRNEVNLKKYFYAVRPALALHWLRDRGEPPPMDLPSLLAGVALPGEVVSALEQLREAKRHASELGIGPPIPQLDAYIEAQAVWGLQARRRAPPPDAELIERSNELFRAAVRGQLR